MVEIPPMQLLDPQATLTEWYATKQQLDEIKFKESRLRRQLMDHFFKGAKEGTNTYLLPGEYQLKGIVVINREVDPGALQANRDRYRKMGINIDTLVEYKPALKIREYRTLTEEERQAFDESLIIKEGSPQLKIDPPSAKARK